MAESKKAVLMMHTDQTQGDLWQTALVSQQLNVTWESISLDLLGYLEGCDRQSLPDLLLMDMAIKSPNSETLQSSSVCQWIAKQKAAIKVVLFNPRQQKIKDIEHSWALRRGASDVLPRLSPENLMAEVARVTAIIGCSLVSQPLEEIAKRLGGRTEIIQSKELALVKPQAERTATNSRSQSKINPKNSEKSDEGEVVMYRGVRIRR